MPGRLARLYRYRLCFGLLCLSGDMEGEDPDWLLDYLCVCGRRFLEERKHYLQQISLYTLGQWGSRTSNTIKSSKNNLSESFVSHMVSVVWVLRCFAVLFRKESTKQLCRGVTEVQDTNPMLSSSWFNFINVKESIFKCTVWSLCLGFLIFIRLVKNEWQQIIQTPLG